MISSNIKTVIRRLERLEEGLPEAVRRAAAPVYWKPRLQASAERVLRGLWALERNLELRAAYERLMPAMLATIEAAATAAGTEFRMSLPAMALGAGRGGDVASAVDFNQAQHTDTGRLSKNFRMPADAMAAQSDNRERVRAGIREWVAHEKIRGPRDAGLSDEEIADRLEWIMGLHRETSPKAYTEAMASAGEGLALRIQQFMDADAAGGIVRLEARGRTMDAETAQGWLKAVLATWSAMLRASLPSRVDVEIGKLFKKIQAELF